MKKRVVAILSVVVLVLVLFLPIPRGTYDDGGTREYTALTYKIVRWNKIMNPGGIYRNSRVFWFADAYKDIDSLWLLEQEHFLSTGVLPTGELPPINTDKAYIQQLRDKYPQFFEVDASAGLIVDVWQMTAGECRCSLVSTQLDAVSDNSFAYDVGTTIQEMRTILTTYALPPERIAVRAVENPLSSYAYTIDEQYKADLISYFWSGENDDFLDAAAFDIDGDDVVETCFLRYGPTSGLATYSISAAVGGTPKYFGMFADFNATVGDLHFEKKADGKTALYKGDTQQKTEIPVTVAEDKIILAEGSGFSEWGEQGVASQYAPYN